MDPQVGSSFIPKKPLGEAPRSSGNGLLFLLAVLVFISSLLAAGAVFGYEQILQRSIASQSASLQLAEGAFEPGVIQELIRLDQRMLKGNELLERHVAPSAIFAFLSRVTLQNVQFTSFSYEWGTDGSAKINLSGIGSSFSDVALQSDQFSASKMLRDVVFSGVTNDTVGRVRFSVIATVDPTLFLYSNIIKSQAGSVQNAPVPNPSASSTPSAIVPPAAPNKPANASTTPAAGTTATTSPNTPAATTTTP